MAESSVRPGPFRRALDALAGFGRNIRRWWSPPSAGGCVGLAYVLEEENGWFAEEHDGAHEPALDDGYAALCLSGGGIRSATFSLGVLQGLARWPARGHASALDVFHYLSTVSGGGYVGSWLMRWIKEHPAGFAGVRKALASDEEQDEITRLRAYSSYLAPKRGVSTDAFTLFGITGRNLLLNWLLLGPALVLLVMVPRLAVALVQWSTSLKGDPVLSTAVAIFAFVVAVFLTVRVIAHVTAELPPRPDGSDATAPFTVDLPVAAFAWSLFWAAVVHPTDAVLFPLCIHVGVAVHVVGVARGVFRSWSASSPGLSGTLGVLLEWAVIIFSGAAAGFLLYQGTRILDPAADPRLYTTMAMPYLLTLYWLATVLYIALVGRPILNRPEDIERDEMSREWWARAGASSLRPLLWWLVACVLVLYAPSYVASRGSRFVAGAGVLAVVSATLSTLIGYFGRDGVEDRSLHTSWAAWLQNRIVPIGAVVALLLIVVLTSLATSYVLVSTTPELKASARAGETLRRNTRSAYEHDLARIAQYKRSFKKKAKAEAEHAPSNVSNAVTNAGKDARHEMAKRRLQEFLGRPFGDWELPLLTVAAVHDAAVVAKKPGEHRTLALGAAVLLMLVVFFSKVVGVNRFSLHNMYGNRLIRAYLGAARAKRNPNRFNRIDPRDDLPIAALRTLPHQRRRPLHIVNMALNRAEAHTTEELAHQKRMAASFTVSPLFAGSRQTGFQPAKTYGGGITQGRAMTISGAAVSPAMGYHSSAPVAALMTLANARLGWWLPNPADVGRHDWNLAEPESGLRPLAEELTGQVGSRSRWIYLSDGGHFDNLGLYEMISRRCHRIVVVDASQDGKSAYDDLARTLRTVRVDHGVSIEFRRRDEPLCGTPPARHFAIARILYPRRGDESVPRPGVLVYIKPALVGDEPLDLRHYAAQRAGAADAFPHESTADQFFDEMQFESYRRLGLLSVEALERAFPDFFDVTAPAAKDVESRSAPRPEVVPARARGGTLRWLADGLGGWGALVAPAALSTAIATTLAVTVSGNVRVEPPKEPLQVQANPPLRLEAATVGLDGDSKTLLQNLVKQIAGRGEGGDPVNPSGRGSDPVAIAVQLDPDSIAKQTTVLEGIRVALEGLKTRAGGGHSPDTEDLTAIATILRTQRIELVHLQKTLKLLKQVPVTTANMDSVTETLKSQVEILKEIKQAIAGLATGGRPQPTSLKISFDPVIKALNEHQTTLTKILEGVDRIPSRRNIRGVRGDE